MSLEGKLGKGTERRKHQRCELDQARAVYSAGILRYVGLGKKTATVYDLSESGVCLQIGERIKPGTRVRLLVSIEKPKESFAAEGVVRQCVTSPEDNKIYTGIKLVNLGQSMQVQLRAMCDYFNSCAYKNLRQQRENDEPWRKLVQM